ncbi:hypothetical protein Tco_1547388 [Tanacetum coccineum]
MDVKTTFLNGPLKEEVYVAQLDGFTKGTIEPTLLTIRYGEDILLLKFYVDDIIFRTSDPPIPMRYLYQPDQVRFRNTQNAWTQLKDYGFDYNKVPLYYDSQSAMAISCNPVQHSRTKHIHTRYHFIKEQVERGIIELYFVRTEYQLVDMLTKALPQDRFEYLVRRIGMRCLTPTELEVLANEFA